MYDRSWKKLAEATKGKVQVLANTGSPLEAPTDQKNEVAPPTVVEVTESGTAKGADQWVPPGSWDLDWADEFDGEGLPDKWIPLIGYNLEAYKKNDAKGIRWSGKTEESAWMCSVKSGCHVLNGDGQLVLRILTNKKDHNEHGPKVNAAYLLSGYPEKWDSSEPNNVRWAGKFVSPADGPLYISARVRSDQVIGHSTWFAFWLFTETRAYNGKPSDGTEVDIIEIPRGEPKYMDHCFNVANHWKKSGGSESEQFNAASRPKPTAYVDVTDEDYHTYGLEWSTDVMKCYVDGKLYYTFTENIPTDPVDMMMLLTMEFQLNSWDRKQGDGRTKGPHVSENADQRVMSQALVDFVRVYRSAN